MQEYPSDQNRNGVQNSDLMPYEDLVENFNALCDKCNRAIDRANVEIANRACLEIELAGLREELKIAYGQISALKSKKYS
jgi:hypothetical protein